MRIKVWQYLPIAFFIVCFPVKAQDLYNLENTLRFADYLMRTRQYHLASQELERAAFLAPDDAMVRLRLLSSYRLAGNYTESIRTVERYFLDSLESMPAPFGREYLGALILDEDYGRAGYFTGKNTRLEISDRNYFSLSLMLLQEDWKAAGNFISENQPQDQRLTSIVIKSENLRYKSAGLALAMSAIVPGSGKVYTKQWKDGLISFIFVATNVWQSYRGFNKNGIESVHGWVFGSLAAGFYGGNLYGSFKSARNYNQSLDNELREETLHIFRSGF